MKKEESFIKKPIFPGGNKGLKEFIYSNLRYPKEALENKIQGVVLVKYDIDYKGNVVDTKVAKGIGYGCDEEAMRIVKLLKFEIPKGPRKLRVLFHQSIKVQFKIKAAPKTKSPNTKLAVEYNFVQSKNESLKQKKESSGYSYTITY